MFSIKLYLRLLIYFNSTHNLFRLLGITFCNFCSQASFLPFCLFFHHTSVSDIQYSIFRILCHESPLIRYLSFLQLVPSFIVFTINCLCWRDFVVFPHSDFLVLLLYSFVITKDLQPFDYKVIRSNISTPFAS